MSTSVHEHLHSDEHSSILISCSIFLISELFVIAYSIKVALTPIIVSASIVIVNVILIKVNIQSEIVEAFNSKQESLHC